MDVIDRFPAEFDRMPHYGSDGCICGNIATPDRECPLHAANWIIERLTHDLRGAVEAIREAQECLSIMGPDGADNSTPVVLARTVLNDYLDSIRKRVGS